MSNTQTGSNSNTSNAPYGGTLRYVTRLRLFTPKADVNEGSKWMDGI